MSSTFASKVAGAVILALLSWGSRAAADSPDAQLAQSLFERARHLMDDKRYAEACPLLMESQRLDPAGGTLLNLAVCHEGEGKLASAWTEFNTALSEAVNEGRRERERIAREHIAAIEPKLARLVVVVRPAAALPGLTVMLDGVVLGEAAYGVAAAVDPGTHKVEAAAPNRRGWLAMVIVDPSKGRGETTTVEVPVLASDQPAPYSGCAAGTFWNGTSCVVRPTPGVNPFADQPYRIRTTSPVAYVLGAFALAAYGTSLVTGIVAWTDHNYVNDHCDLDRGYCDGQTGIDKQSAMRTWAWVSTVSLGTAFLSTAGFFLWPNQLKVRTVGLVPLTGGAVLAVGGQL